MSQDQRNRVIFKPFNNRVPTRDIAELKQVAQDNGLTLAELHRYLLRDGLDRLASGQLRAPNPEPDRAA